MSEQVHPYCRCLYYAGNALPRNMSRLGEDAFARTGLAPSLGFLLMTVNRSPGVRPPEAAEIMMLDPSTVTRLVEKLQSKGLVTRKTQGRTFLDLLRTRPRQLSPGRHAASLDQLPQMT